MGSNQEIIRIQTWVADWWGTTVEECAYSREDIRNICRGPMRDVLLNFVTPRFRTDEQIKVIRSNLYLQDLNNQGGSDSGAEAFVNEEQIKGLKQQLEQIREEKAAALKLILKNVEDVELSKLEIYTKLQQNLAVFEDLEANAHLVKNRVLSTNSLLQDVNAIKKSEQELTSFKGVSGTKPSPQTGLNDSMSPETANPQMVQLYLLYQNAYDLFNQFFHQSYNGSSKQSNSLSPEIQTLSSAVSTQISDLIKSGVSPALIEKWARLEEEKSSVDMRMMSSKISNVMSPLEELSAEVDTLYVKLMKAHVNIHYRKKDVESKLNDLRDQNTIKIRDAILKDSSIVPADFLSFIQKEEMHKKLLKCRELARKLRYGTSPSEQDNILNFLCEEFSQTEENMNATRECSATGNKGSMSSLDGNSMNSSFMKQQTLEDLSCALLKSFPQSRNQLGKTIEQCRGLVLDKFPQMNILMNSGKKDNMQFPPENSLGSKERLSEMTTKDINIPHELLFNFNKMSISSSYVDSDEQNILLGEAFKLQSELDKKRTQSEMLVSERAFNKLKE